MIEHRRRGATNQVLLGFAMVMIGLPWLMVAETEGPPRTLAEGDSTRPPALDLIGSAPVRSKPASSTSTAVVLPDRGRYEFRDVATDEVVPGLAFTSRAASSNSGLVAGDGPDAANMHLSDVRWALVSEAPSRDSRWALPAYWVGRRIRIHGRVLAAPGEVGPIDVGALRVTLEAMGPPESTISSFLESARLPADGPRSDEWLSGHRLSSRRPKRFDVETGTFEFEALALRRLGLQVRGRAWSCPTQAIGPSVLAGSSEINVDVFVRRVCRVVGRVADARGEPVAGARVRLQFHRSIPTPLVDPGRLADLGGGFGIAGQPDGTSGVMVAFAAVSDSSGEFAVESPGGLDWPATLLVIAGPSSRPSRRELPVAAESGLVSVEALRSDRSTRLSASGLALGGASVLISDITDRRNQLALGSASSDATGRLPGAWLEPGRDYFLFVTRNGDSIGHPYFVRWRDADELDLAALHSNLTEFESDNAK